MVPRLGYFDLTRPRGRFSRAIVALSATRRSRFLSLRVAWKVDPHLLRATRGRVGTGPALPTALLKTRSHADNRSNRRFLLAWPRGARRTRGTCPSVPFLGRRENGSRGDLP